MSAINSPPSSSQEIPQTTVTPPSPSMSRIHSLIYLSPDQWSKKLAILIQDEQSKILQDAYAVNEKLARFNYNPSQEDLDALHSNFRLAEFHCWKERIGPTEAAFRGNLVKSHSASSRSRILQLFVMMLLQKDEIKEDLAWTAEKISNIFQVIYPTIEPFGRARDLFEKDILPGATVCKLIIGDALIHSRIDRAILFVSYLTFVNLKIGSAEYLAKDLVNFHNYQLSDILKVDDPKLKDFLLYYLARRLLENAKADEYHYCTSLIKEINLYIDLQLLDNPVFTL